ncbi:hypothetical protein SELMODRAFT_417670 [Selaginella moellendorffii]|uniref:Peptidase C1A papain C-terminal domain-containing protein n=1 Tax=Selaginella moellendorffii TaxID=88036 RepID=D8S372_SELML|nr:hypothetical protein SELMODRAFT_417670 [Selaginella moellendorffii]
MKATIIRDLEWPQKRRRQGHLMLLVADSSVDVAVAAPSINWKTTLGLRDCWVICSIGLMESLIKIAGHNELLSIQFCNDFCEPGFEAKDSLKTKFLGSIGFTVSCEGGSPGACLDFLTNVGVPRAANYRQYQARNRSRLEIAYDKWLYGDPEKFRLKRVANMGVDIGNLVDESAILAFASWLTHRGPAVTAVKCRDWGRDSLDNNYVYVGDYEQEFKHCLLVVGFKWKERLWTLLNSHGESYGDSGLFYIHFGDKRSGFGEIFHVANF